MDIKIVKTTSPKEHPESSTLGFGKFFTDHMFIMDYSREKGWYDARIVPFGRIELHPASTVLQYVCRFSSSFHPPFDVVIVKHCFKFF